MQFFYVTCFDTETMHWSLDSELTDAVFELGNALDTETGEFFVDKVTPLGQASDVCRADLERILDGVNILRDKIQQHMAGTADSSELSETTIANN